VTHDSDQVNPSDPVDSDIAIGDAISDRVRAVLDRHKRTANLFNGRGPTATGPDGQPMPTTSATYDELFVRELVANGVRDASDLATALWHRPDDAVRLRGRSYVVSIVRAALAAAAAAAATARAERREATGATDDDDDGPAPDVIVERLVVYMSDPPHYEMAVGGQHFRLSAAQLLSPQAFERRYLEVLGRVPRLPGQKTWHAIVNAWLAKAEKVEQPDDASTDGFARAEILRALEDMPRGTEAADLLHDRVVDIGGRATFTLAAVRRRLRDAIGDVDQGLLAKYLRDVGCEPCQLRIDGEPRRLWRRPPAAADHPDDGEPASSETGEAPAEQQAGGTTPGEVP